MIFFGGGVRDMMTLWAFLGGPSQNWTIFGSYF